MEGKVFKSGFIGIIGKPNVGKSTLLNTIIGEKLAITTHKPQTTRNRITGIKNTEDGQFIFLDTPGIHRAKTLLNRSMVKEAINTFADVEILLLIMEAHRSITADDDFIFRSLEGIDIPVILIINKIDLIEKEQLLPLIERLRHIYPFSEIVPLSALKGFNIDTLMDTLWGLLSEGPRYFPDDMITDSSERFLAAEIIREKILLLTHQEIPYSTAVVIDSFKENEARGLIRMQATISVEKKSQKGILIGRKGAMLKQIGTRARLDMEKFFGTRVFLELFVRVTRDWTRDSQMLEEFGYNKT
ncbi:MAG: GTPase Era [Deltaproteobacteria bacterium]|nr:GTPase Era [Deltaproteobacteria bacterium]MBN2845326.1 GTPase Era [Deltaproteobacteria bacterium]